MFNSNMFDDFMKNMARRLQRNLYILMGTLEDKPISNEEMAKRSGLDPSTISRIKRDFEGKQRVTYETVLKLAIGLNVDPTALLKEV